jgi:hypothetical protein
MERPFSRLAVGIALCLGVASVACTPSNKVKAGAPVMLKFGALDPTGTPIELVTEAGATPVPPLATFAALFDRLLDPTALAEVKDDGGTIVPSEGVALIDSEGTAVMSDAIYTPNGDAKFTLIYPPGPSLSIVPTLGLPSGSPVTVALNPEHVRSHDQTKPFVAGEDATDTLTFDTEPLAASIAVPAPEAPDGGGEDDAGAGGDGGIPAAVAPPVESDIVVTITFNNQTDDLTKMAIVAPTAAGEPMVARGDTANVWTVSPPTGGWPAGATVTVTVKAAAADNFGKILGMDVASSFTVKP